MAEIIRWEYRTISLGTFWSTPKESDMEAALNELGLDGWEVFSVYTQYGTNKVSVVAKRPLTGEVRRQRNWPE